MLVKFLIGCGILFLSLPVHANPACIVCSITIGASLELARKLGVHDEVVGVWAGALLTLMGYWLILWFDKKQWYFPLRNITLILFSLSMVGFLYINELVYTPKPIGFLYIDHFLFAVFLGAVLYIYSQKLYMWLKTCNSGHAHFPFEKVILPMASLLIASFVFTFYPLS